MNTLILGIGNILWADEGFGVRAVESLDTRFRFPESVTLADGGTQGIYLLASVQRADILVIFDAVDFALAPGQLKLIEDDAVPSYLGAKKMSLHQTGFQEVLAMAEMLGNSPQHLLLVGVQPTILEDFGGSLHPVTAAQIDPAIQAACEWLTQFGIEATRRTEPPTEPLAGHEVDRLRYETERPSAMTACRMGDERVLNSSDYAVGYRPFPLDPENRIGCDVDHRGKYGSTPSTQVSD